MYVLSLIYYVFTIIVIIFTLLFAQGTIEYLMASILITLLLINSQTCLCNKTDQAHNIISFVEKNTSSLFAVTVASMTLSLTANESRSVMLIGIGITSIIFTQTIIWFEGDDEKLEMLGHIKTSLSLIGAVAMATAILKASTKIYNRGYVSKK